MIETRKLPVSLTGPELLAKGAELAAGIRRVKGLKDEKADLTAMMKRATEAGATLTDEIAHRQEIRNVECNVTHDFDDFQTTVTRCDTGEQIERRPMSDAERQLELDFGDAPEQGDEPEADAENPPSEAD